MTEEEKNYYDELMKLDIDEQVLKALRLNKDDEVEFKLAALKAAKKIEDDIDESRMNIFMSYKCIDSLRDSITNIIEKQKDSDISPEEIKIGNDIISNAIKHASDLFDNIQDFVDTIDMDKSTLQFIDEMIRSKN